MNLNSGRGRGDEHVRRHPVAHAARGVPRLGPDRRRAHRVRVRHQREQGREPHPRRVFHIYALVGEEESPVRFPFLFGFFPLFVGGGRLDGWLVGLDG